MLCITPRMVVKQRLSRLQCRGTRHRTVCYMPTSVSEEPIYQAIQRHIREYRNFDAYTDAVGM